MFYFSNNISLPSTLCIYTLIPNGIFTYLQQRYPDVFSIQTNGWEAPSSRSSASGTKRDSSPSAHQPGLVWLSLSRFFWSVLVSFLLATKASKKDFPSPAAVALPGRTAQSAPKLGCGFGFSRLKVLDIKLLFVWMCMSSVYTCSRPGRVLVISSSSCEWGIMDVCSFGNLQLNMLAVRTL